MEIEFNTSKDLINQEKHGISLADAADIEWDTLYAEQDTRFDYSEARIIGFAYIGLRLFCVIYTDRGNVRRIISLRKANKREVNRYAKA